MTNSKTKMPIQHDVVLSPLKLGGVNSIFLDILRLSCACVVLMHHAVGIWQEYGAAGIEHTFAPGSFWWLVVHAASHWAVIVFFVLSGYVIAHVTSRSISFQDYMVARLSRLYSILIPALLLTAFVELLIRVNSPELLAEFVRGASLPRYGITLLLWNELWLFSAAPKINGPLWSLSFELWYYLIFGLWLFRKQLVGGGWLLLVACLVAGPKILLLMPCWAAGVLAYRISQHVKYLPFRSIWTAIGIVAFSFFLLSYTRGWPGNVGQSPLYFSNQFLTDYVSASLIALALVMLPQKSSIQIPAPLFRLIRRLGDLTYPIYALHMPILIVLVVIAPGLLGVTSPGLPVLVVVALTATLLLGLLAERTRDLLRRLFTAVFDFKRKLFSLAGS
ncbi:MAG: acyltransferase [Burkholderiaceae bacterium]|nr:acyltransferase [Burkholderiaceae bacterium]